MTGTFKENMKVFAGVEFELKEGCTVWFPEDDNDPTYDNNIKKRKIEKVLKQETYGTKSSKIRWITDRGRNPIRGIKGTRSAAIQYELSNPDSSDDSKETIHLEPPPAV